MLELNHAKQQIIKLPDVYHCCQKLSCRLLFKSVLVLCFKIFEYEREYEYEYFEYEYEREKETKMIRWKRELREK